MTHEEGMLYYDEQRMPMPRRILCNVVQREGAKLSPDLASELFCYVLLHKIWYGILLEQM